MNGIRAFLWTLAACLALIALGAGSAQALTLQPVGNFNQPTYVTSDPGDASRLFVVERAGTIQLVESGVRHKFADLTSQVECGSECKGERGLLSIALSPSFNLDGRLYVDYANNVDGTIHVEELVSKDAGHKTADTSTLRSLASIPHPDAENHNGGQLQFGPDGNLYISTGDGGGGNDEFHNAQDPSSPLGKILEIDPDSATPYSVWSYGLRNPYRFSFDSESGDMVIADVGQSAREEIDFAPSPAPDVVGGAGVNYGWNCREGFLPGPGTDPGCLTVAIGDFAPPVFDYPHTPDPDLGGANRCSIIGGYVARDPALDNLDGNYVYADLCSGAIRSLQLPVEAGRRAGGDCSLGLEVDRPVSFGEDAARRLYVVEQGGAIFRLTGSPPASCPVPAPPPALPPTNTTQLKPTLIGIKAQRRRVERGQVALLTVFVSPCDGRKGDPIELLRNGRPNGTRSLSRACTARFLPRVHRGTTFTAVTRSDREFVAGKSRNLTIRLVPPRKRHR
jgi:hypothetical protein